jgi:hypothetical protein
MLLSAGLSILEGVATPGMNSSSYTLDHGAQSPQRIDLAERLAKGGLNVGTREVTPIPDRAGAIHVREGSDLSVIWLDGTDFREGTIELDIRGRDLLQRSFLGVAFHRQDDKTYDTVYLRPFNFRAEDPMRHQHAVQYMAIPNYEWSILRKQFPEEFENPVDASVNPNDWFPVRIEVRARTIRIFVGGGTEPALEVRKLGPHDRGMVGLWTGGGSDGSYANVRLTPRP